MTIFTLGFLVLTLPLAVLAAGEQKPALWKKALETKEAADSSCAKIALSAIYGAEKTYFGENGAYSDKLDQIGFEAEGDCAKNWNNSVTVGAGGKEFLATSTHKTSGETWTMDQQNNLRSHPKAR